MSQLWQFPCGGAPSGKMFFWKGWCFLPDCSCWPCSCAKRYDSSGLGLWRLWVLSGRGIPAAFILSYVNISLKGEEKLYLESNPHTCTPQLKRTSVFLLYGLCIPESCFASKIHETASAEESCHIAANTPGLPFQPWPFVNCRSLQTRNLKRQVNHRLLYF